VKKLLLILTFALSAETWAQYTVAPFGSASSSTPPVGQNRKNSCAGGGCEFELNIKPYCFGTNLRAYSVSRQLNPSQDIFMSLDLKDPKSGKEDSFKVQFPARLTYASKGVSVDCIFEPDQDMNEPGYKKIACPIAWKQKDYKFMLSNWLQSTNPQDNPYLGADFNKYAGAPLPATIHGATDPEVDNNINCFYKFTSNNKHGTLLKSSVSCYFPSSLPDYSSAVVVHKDGKPLSPSEYEVNAHSNSIKIKLKTQVNAITGNNPVRHGKLVVSTPPRHSSTYEQPDGTNFRTLASKKEIESFDQASGYKSFTAQVKFPGMEGFCGGYYSPLMLFFDEKIPHFTGVSLFQLYGIEPGTRVHWPERNAPGYFLAHLPKGVKTITSYKQLFSQTDQFANGFDTLAEYDSNKDGVIDHKDPIFKDLRLWNDKNGNGVSEADEIFSLKDKSVTSISLKYDASRTTNFGGRATAREKSTFKYKSNGKEVAAQIYDVWLSPID